MKYPIRETSLLTISSVVTRLFSVLFTVLLAKALTVSDFGLFRYLITICGFYAILFAGIPLALTKYISENKNNVGALTEYLTNAIFLSIALFIFVIIAIIIFSSNKIFIILLLFAFLLDYFYMGFIRGLLNYTKLIGFKLLENIIQLTLLSGFIIFSGRIEFSLAVIFFSFSGVFALIAFELKNFELKMNFRSISRDRVKELAKYSIPVVAGSVGWTMMFGINTILIEKFYGNNQVAFYNVAFTLSQIFSFLPEAISTIILPKVSAAGDKSKIAAPLRMAVLGCIALSILALSFLMIFKEIVVKMLFNENYLPALTMLLPLSLSQIAISIHQIYASVFQGLNKPGIPTTTISIAAVIQIVGGYLGIKYYGINGAAVSICISSIIALIAIYVAWLRKGYKLHLNAEIIK